MIEGRRIGATGLRSSPAMHCTGHVNFLPETYCENGPLLMMTFTTNLLYACRLVASLEALA